MTPAKHATRLLMNPRAAVLLALHQLGLPFARWPHVDWEGVAASLAKAGQEIRAKGCLSSPQARSRL